MGSIYRPKYRNAASELVEASVWWLKYRANGRVVREATDPKTDKESIARGQLRVKEGDAERGLPVVKVNRKPVGALLDDVLTDYANQGLDSIDAATRRIEKHLRPFFGNWNAAGVSDDQVREYITTRMAAGAKRSTVNRELSLLKRGYSLNARAVTTRPAIPIAKEKNARKGFFERKQFEAVRAALPDYLQPLLTIAYVTGWRVKSELLPMEWRQVDFKARTLRLEPGTTKNDEGREFPFTQELEAALLAQRAHTEAVQKERGAIIPYVFHRGGRQVRYWRRPWLQALLTVGLAVREANEDGTPKKGGKILPAVMPHDFRRTAIRNLARAGVSEAIAMKMCGHETRSVFDRYNIVTGDDLVTAAAKLDAAGKVLGKVGDVEAISGTANTAKPPKSLMAAE